MKKIFAIICATITLFSCSQSDLVEIDNTKNQNPQDNHVNFNIKVDGETKALKSSWATGDVIYIMFKNIKNKYVAITYNGATWDAQAYDANNTATTIEVEELPSENRLAAAVHFPVAVDVALDATDGVLSFTKNDMPVRTNFVKQKNQSYTVDGSTVNLTLSLQKDMYWVLFHVAGIQKYPQDYKLVITPKGNAQPINFMCTSLSHTGAVTNSLINDPQGFQGYADADGVIFPVYFSNGNGLNTDIEYDFTVKSSVLECTISGTLNLKAGYQYSLPALADSKWTKNYKYVDMGNGTKWATGNVGAYSLYDYGDYFAWGDTVPYYEAGHAQDNPQNYWKEGKTAGYFWNSYKWIEPTEDDQGDLIYNSDNITKYSFADGNTYGRWYNGNDFVGDEGDGVEHKDFASYNYVDDPARYNWGGAWRTPTKQDWDWLIANCTWVSTKDYNGSGVKGYIVTSKITGYENSIIFIPAAGFRSNLGNGDVNKFWYYWSSSLCDSTNPVQAGSYRAWHFYSLSSPVVNSHERQFGNSIRPVCD